MSGEQEVYYWDACIFLEHLRDEPVAPLKKQRVLKILQENKEGKNIIFTSAISHLECLPKKLTLQDAESEVLYRSMFGTRNFYDVPIDAQILMLARDIRDFYFVEGDPKAATHHKMMGLGDAIHLATAIVHGATVMHTRDAKKKGGNVPLLGLPEMSPEGKIAGKWDLKIESPEDAQTDIVILADEMARRSARKG